MMRYEALRQVEEGGSEVYVRDTYLGAQRLEVLCAFDM